MVLNWNSAPDTLACLDSISQLHYANYTVLVVDNASTDDSVRQIRKAYPHLEILALKENLGYSGGNNRGIEFALAGNCDYVWLLNDDTVVAPDSLASLVSVATSEPAAGILGPKVYTSEEPQTILSAGATIVNGWRAQSRGVGQTDRGQFDHMADVDVVSGCAMLVSRRLIEQIGTLDESFFAYHEDVEWCYRAKQAGFRVLLVPQAHVWHPDTRRRDEYSAVVVYYMTRNTLFFVSKHRLGLRVLAEVLLDGMRTLASWSLRRCWRHKRRQRDALALAILDFFRGMDGRCERL